VSTKEKDLPPVEGLTRRQLRGGDCVHCGVTLAPGDVTDLGEQVDDIIGVWCPRAHPRCLHRMSQPDQTMCIQGERRHPFPYQDETGAYCQEHGVTLLWHADPAAGTPASTGG
jgi:hypothetical protein